MAPTGRPRSSTSASTVSNRPRPISRASTNSINTVGESYNAISSGPKAASATDDNLIRLRANQFSPEEMISRSETQLKNPNLVNVADSSTLPGAQSRAMSVDTTYSGSHEASGSTTQHKHSYDGLKGTAFAAVNESASQLDSSKEATLRKAKSNAATQANDQELRRLFQENCSRNLKDVAASVLANERGPKAEKTKQIFAMNWYTSSCPSIPL